MIQDAIKQAQRMHRQAVEGAYDGLCAVYERQSREDPETLDTVFKEILVSEGIPCHLSYSASPETSAGETGSAVIQVIKLYLAPEVELKPGSKLVVAQQGMTGCYSRSGQPAVYSSHQEVQLTLFRGYA